MSEKCRACGKAFIHDDEYPGLYDRACECMACPRCGIEYLPDDDNGPQIAPSDDEAHLDGLCLGCMNVARARGR